MNDAFPRLLDLAKNRGFRFWRTAPGEDGPLWGERESPEWLDTIFLAGFSDSGNATRYASPACTGPVLPGPGYLLTDDS